MSVKTKNDLHIPYTWEERQPVFLERFFYIPKAFDHSHAERIHWADPQIFGNDQAVCMEICSGNGQWIGDRALAQPDKNWVAVEMCFERARTIWMRIQREKIPNLYVICAEASVFLRYYAPQQSVCEAFINFPDPWPKRRHQKHRLIWAPFLHLLRTIVLGQVTLATDDLPYYEQMKREFAQTPFWQAVPFDPAENYGDSFFAALWRSKGRKLYYLQYANGTC